MSDLAGSLSVSLTLLKGRIQKRRSSQPATLPLASAPHTTGHGTLVRGSHSQRLVLKPAQRRPQLPAAALASPRQSPGTPPRKLGRPARQPSKLRPLAAKESSSRPAEEVAAPAAGRKPRGKRRPPGNVSSQAPPSRGRSATRQPRKPSRSPATISGSPAIKPRPSGSPAKPKTARGTPSGLRKPGKSPATRTRALQAAAARSPARQSPGTRHRKLRMPSQYKASPKPRPKSSAVEEEKKGEEESPPPLKEPMELQVVTVGVAGVDAVERPLDGHTHQVVPAMEGWALLGVGGEEPPPSAKEPAPTNWEDVPIVVKRSEPTYDKAAFRKQRTDLVWQVEGREEPCVRMAAGSTCMCGHPYESHPEPFKCILKGCKCQGFTYIVKEANFELRCSCKHKAADHSCATAAHECSRIGCSCTGFSSPWRCGVCGNPWKDHSQKVVLRCMAGEPPKEAAPSLCVISPKLYAVARMPGPDSRAVVAV